MRLVAGQGALLTRTILCPDRSRRRVLRCYPHQGSHRGCHQGCLGDIPRRWGGHGEGLPDVGRQKSRDINTGYCFLGPCYIPGPVLGALHVRPLMTSTTLQGREKWGKIPIW